MIRTPGPRIYHPGLLVKTAMALPRYARGLRSVYWCCGLWVGKGVLVPFSEDDIMGASNDTST